MEDLSISSSEWEVMRVIWAQGESKSKAIFEILHQKFNWSESTVKTLLGRLVDKGCLTTERDGRAYLYRSLLDEQAIYQMELESVLSKICQRQHFSLVKKVLEDLPMTVEQVADLEALLLSKKVQTVQQVACNCLQGQCNCVKEGCHG